MTMIASLLLAEIAKTSASHETIQGHGFEAPPATPDIAPCLPDQIRSTNLQISKCQTMTKRVNIRKGNIMMAPIMSTK